MNQFSNELEQWERSRPPQVANGHAHLLKTGNEEAQMNGVMINGNGHQRHSSEYSGEWAHSR